MAPPEIKGFQLLSLFMKDISIVTGHLSKMMTSNYSSDHSTSCCQQGKPTARSNSWKHRYHSEDKNSVVYKTSILQNDTSTRTPVFKTKKSFRQPTASLSVGEDQERMKRNKCSKSLIELAAYPIENTGSKVCSGNTTVNFSSDSDLSPTCKPNTLEEYSKEINATTINKDSNSSSNQPDANNNKNYNEKEHNSKPTNVCTGSNINTDLSKAIDMTVTKTNDERISKDSSNKSPSLVTSNRNSTNFSKRNNTNLSSNINKETNNDTSTKTKRTNATITVNKEKPFKSQKSSNTICSNSLQTKIKEIQENTIGDAIQIKDEIQRFILKRTIRQSTTIKETISKTLKNITIDIDSAINIDKKIFPNKDYNELNNYIEEIKKQKQSFYFEFLNKEEIQICNSFYDSDYTTREELYFNNSKTPNIMMKTINKYSCYY
ncbi:hypothetical protein O181_098563 [Austropuccinia psidii MF-1]|uniref:Uncharacterized protein n=1 Tax=Austropuccinia psidii MF-1 TaxID=1389203 RepID=A0A9Q3J9H2_9BASI|nr:hypothetical protein [Austropuccinia psidii MF-1]